jgi:hypothetical protein
LLAEESQKEEMNKYSHKSLSMIFKTDKNQELKQQKQSLIEAN